MAANDVETAVHRVRGYEVHPGAAKTARAAVTNHLIARGWNGGIASSAADRIIETTDFLLSSVPCSSYDVVAANPPYWGLLAHLTPESPSIGREHASTPVTHAHLACRLLIDKNPPSRTHTQTTPISPSYHT